MPDKITSLLKPQSTKPAAVLASMRAALTGDEAFEAYRAKKYGAYDAYPLEAYTHFMAGFAAALSRSEQE